MRLTGSFRRIARPVAVVVAALLATACAGSLDKYRNGLPVAAGGTGSAPVGTALATGGPEPAPVADAGAAAAVNLSGSTAGSPAVSSARQTTGGAATGSAGTGTAAGPVSAATTGGHPAAGPQSPGSTPVASAAGGSGADPATPAPTSPAVPGGPRTTTGVTKDTVTVGFFYPKTGAYTGLARNATAVMQAALDEAGPIHGRKLVLKTYDDGTANASTIQVEEKRAKDEAFGLMSIVSESNVVLAPIADQHKVPLLLINVDEKVALPLTSVFPLGTFWERQATILPGFIKNVLGGGGKRIGVVYEGTSTAKAAKEAFKAKAAQMGLQIVFEQPIAMNQSTCANEVSNLQAKQVELVYMMNGPLGGICMLRDSRALNYKPTWTGVGVSWNFNVVAAASGGAADGIRTLASMTTLDTPAGRHFAEVVRKAAPNTGAENDDIMLIVYSLAQTFLEGLRRTGPDLSREAFVQTMETKMSGYESGYLPPPTFGPGNRSGPLSVGVSACCTNNQWTMPAIGWHAEF
jgi:ABC-type branched-subunit amino acid transport system substrate-binding protein